MQLFFVLDSLVRFSLFNVAPEWAGVYTKMRGATEIGKRSIGSGYRMGGEVA